MASTEKLFIVDEINDGRSTQCVWKGTLYLVKSAWFILGEGEKKGLKFCIPLEHPSYTDELEKRLEKLTEKDRVYLKVKSKTDRKVEWLIQDIKWNSDDENSD